MIDVDAVGGLAQVGFADAFDALQEATQECGMAALWIRNIRRAAGAGEPIPAGWALGPDGEQTQDAAAALRGTLLPFGSLRGGNVALLVEVLATLSGASFSLDAAPFDSGATSPGIGVFLLAIDPAHFAGSVERLSRQFESLRDDHRCACRHSRWPRRRTSSRSARTLCSV